jgi:soluble lytic murein transglycosylase-like protein
MSISGGGLEAVQSATRPGGWESITAAAAERVQQLQALIAQVEHPSAASSFASALASAQSGSAEPAATSAGASTYPASTADGYASALSTADFSSALPTADGYTTVESPGSAYTSAAPAMAAYSPATATPAGVSSAGVGSAYAPLVEQSAARYGLNPAILHGLIQQESGFDPSARSSAGALGLTQLMPSTAASLGVAEPLDPAQSIEGGARYLSQLLQQFDGNTADALAAYNAGPGAVEQYGGVPPYSETQQYVGKVLGYAAAYSQGGESGPQALAAGTAAVAPASGGTSIATPSEAIA